MNEKERQRRINVKPPRPGLCEQDVKRKSKIKKKNAKVRSKAVLALPLPFFALLRPSIFGTMTVPHTAAKMLFGLWVGLEFGSALGAVPLFFF